MLIKTFFFLRIFKASSQLVMMMIQVTQDLRAFMIFYFIVLWFCSLIMSILGTDEMKDNLTSTKLKKSILNMNEYEYLPFWTRQFFASSRISLADFNFKYVVGLSVFDQNVFWLIWFIQVVLTCICCLNFIIAEVSSSYQSVKDRVNGLIRKEQAQMI